VIACCVGAAAKGNVKSGDEPASDSTPWTCARWASEDTSSRTVWASSALAALRRKDGLPEPTDAQVAVFASQLSTACEPVPGSDLAEMAATLYVIGR
jgi:hypothetical protein